MAFKPFQTLLFGFAFSPSLKANVFEVTRLASFFNSKLIFVHVGEKTREKEAEFNQLLEQCSLKPAIIDTHWKSGEPVKVLTDSCREFGIDLLLIGALKRENVLKYYLGSIARKLTRQAACSVLLMLKPSVERSPCRHIVVNGFDSPKTQETVEAAFYVADSLVSQKVTLVEEISESRVAISVDDDKSLRKATLRKEKIDRQEKKRVTDIVQKIPLANKKSLNWETQSIFGKRGYSIGHYARVVRADLLVMNAQKKTGFFSRFYIKDLEYILAELPTDVLIIQSRTNG